ncbi:MAG: dienelactone hydrolase family protein [Puniceicoccales bacterium]|jgi:predicted peptidase|nr:dienelactone hydrolase family protein [Puniceicoccales bacterium]
MSPSPLFRLSRRAALPLLAALPLAFAATGARAASPITPAGNARPARARPFPDCFEARAFTRAGATLPYRLLSPEKIENAKKYPLVIFLHGVGERGTDNAAQVRNGIERLGTPALRKKFPCYAIVPQCPPHSFWGIAPERSRAAPDALNLVLNLVDETLRTTPTADRRRVYVAGLSMGGIGTFRLLEARPRFFAAALPICGTGNAERAKSYASTPVWIFHGEKDTVVRPDGSKRIAAALKAAGCKVKFSLVPDVGHNVWVNALGDDKTWEWLFAQHR